MIATNQPPPVVLVTSTIMEGTVARWYRDVTAAEQQRPVLSASRKGVSVHAEFLTSIPQSWIDVAFDTYTVLARDRSADVSHLATHRHRVTPNGPLEPIEEPVEEGGDV